MEKAREIRRLEQVSKKHIACEDDKVRDWSGKIKFCETEECQEKTMSG